MASGDTTFFEEALEYKHDGGWEAADDLKVAILDNTATPTAAFATPSLSDFTEVGTGGTYSAGGISIGNWGAFLSEAAGILTADSATVLTWALHASNDVDAFWALLYHVTSDKALLFIDLAGPVDMQGGALTVTPHANGYWRETIT